MLVHREPAFENGVDVARDHPDAVRIVAGEVGLDQVAGDQRRLARLRAALDDDGFDRAPKALGIDYDVRDHSHSPLAFFATKL